MDLFDRWFGGLEKPKWRENYDRNLSRLEYQTGLTKDQLKKVADAIQELNIIKL